VISLVSACALLASERRAQAEPAAIPAAAPAPLPPPPPVEYPPSGARAKVLLTGAGVFAGFYGIALGESFAWSKAPYAEKLRIPVAGPWMTIAHAGCAPGEASCTNVLAVIRAVVAGIAAVGQVGGLAVMAEGAFMRTSSAAAPKPAKASLFRGFSVVADGERVGVGLSGAF
jgi:hypothetical protein